MVVEHEAAHESQWAAIGSIAEKIGCSAETLRKWVRQAERNAGTRPGLTTEERERLKQLERENVELRAETADAAEFHSASRPSTPVRPSRQPSTQPELSNFYFH